MLTGKTLLIASAIALMAACTTATPYQPSETTGNQRSPGFAETRIADDRFRVSFKGNSRTDRETVELYVLYRAAEVALSSGADSFVITNRDTEADVRYVTTTEARPTLFPRAHGNRLRSGVFPAFHTVEALPVPRYQAFAEIRTFTGDAPEGGDAYDARDVITSLKPKIVLPEEE